MEKVSFSANTISPSSLLFFIIIVIIIIVIAMATWQHTTVMEGKRKLGVIIGRVTDKAQAPIPDAKVAIIKGTASYPDIAALTDENGEYDLEYISTGTFTVAASKEGYATQTRTIKVRVDEEVRLDFVLSPKS